MIGVEAGQDALQVLVVQADPGDASKEFCACSATFFPDPLVVSCKLCCRCRQQRARHRRWPAIWEFAPWDILGCPGIGWDMVTKEWYLRISLEIQDISSGHIHEKISKLDILRYLTIYHSSPRYISHQDIVQRYPIHLHVYPIKISLRYPWYYPITSPR